MVLPQHRPTAYHEAGHAAVICRLVPHLAQDVFLDEDNPNQGGAKIRREDIDAAVRILIKCAGPLAELKHLASDEWACPVTFDATDVGDLCWVAYEEDALETSDPLVWFQCGAGERRSYRARDGNTFSDFEDLAETGETQSIEPVQFREWLRQAMSLLDDPALWTRVEAVAERLLASGVVSRECLIEIVSGLTR
jgi:hypothetical protein